MIQQFLQVCAEGAGIGIGKFQRNQFVAGVPVNLAGKTQAGFEDVTIKVKSLLPLVLQAPKGPLTPVETERLKTPRPQDAGDAQLGS